MVTEPIMVRWWRGALVVFTAVIIRLFSLLFSFSNVIILEIVRIHYSLNGNLHYELMIKSEKWNNNLTEMSTAVSNTMSRTTSAETIINSTVIHNHHCGSSRPDQFLSITLIDCQCISETRLVAPYWSTPIKQAMSLIFSKWQQWLFFQDKLTLMPHTHAVGPLL